MRNALLGRLGRELAHQLDRLRAVRVEVVRPPSPPDPFRTLTLQDRLGRLAAEIDRLGDDPRHEFACGFHSQAALLAYEQTLLEACDLAGLPRPERGEGNATTRRLLAEATLADAGWRW